MQRTLQPLAVRRRDYGAPKVEQFTPWIARQQKMCNAAAPNPPPEGILERWPPRFYEYVVPESGRTFRISTHHRAISP